MAGRGPRSGGAGDARGPSGPSVPAPVRSVVRVHDLAGRPRGAGFAADEHGTVITSHEAVDGLARVVLHAPGERTCVVHAADVVALPDAGLALIRTEGLGLRPLPVSVRDSVPRGAYVRIDACGWREARVLGSAPVTYTATDRFHLVGAALELAIGTDGADALRLGGGAAGGPVVDAASGAVVAVLGTALLPQSPEPAPPGRGRQEGARGPEDPYGPDGCAHRPAGYAVALRDAAAADPAGPLAALLARNAATVPAYGKDLNLAGALHLTATSSGCDGPPAPLHEPVERPDVAGEFAAFTAGSARVLGLVGDPGTGRTTELAALAGRRARGAEPAPTLWLRGADLCGTDGSVADAVERALERAARILEAAGEAPANGLGDASGDGMGDVSADRVARLVRDAGRPLLLLLDGPEEMPPALAHRLARWSEGTECWLRETGARLVVACRAEYWEQAAAHFDAASLHVAGGGAGPPGWVRLGGLPEPQAGRARARYGIPDGALPAVEARHPLALRLLGEVRAALPDAPPPGTPDREEIFGAHLDLLCLRIAVRLAAANGLRGSAVRRLAAVVSGQVHEAARRCLGPGQGGLDRAAFEEVFPWGAPVDERSGKEFSGCTGWASAVLTEGLLVPAGTGYRFAHEELADWLQGMHLDVDGALLSLVHRHRHGAAARPARVPGGGGPTPAAPRPLPVPRHRIGPVIQALLLLGRQRGAAELASRLLDLTDAWGECAGGEGEGAGAGAGESGDAAWWASRLLGEVLLRVPDAAPYLAVLEPLAERGEFGTSFWLRLPLGEADRFALLRRLVVRDGPPGAAAGRCLDAVAELLVADPAAVQPHLVRWFDDERPLQAAPHATVASAAQALLHTHRHRAIDHLIETLVVCGGAGGGACGAASGGGGAEAPVGCAEEGAGGSGGGAVGGAVGDAPVGHADAGAGASGGGTEVGRGDFPGGSGEARAEALADALADLAESRPGCGELPGDADADADADFDGGAEAAVHRPDTLAGSPAVREGNPAAGAESRAGDDSGTDAVTGRGGTAPFAEHESTRTAAPAAPSRSRTRVAARADELLAALVEEEPSAVCRAVARWARDERAALRRAAAVHGPRVAPHAADGPARDLLRHAAFALLARDDDTLHGAALALLVHDPRTRSGHLTHALARFAAGDPLLPATAPAAALPTHPGPVLDAFRTRLTHLPGPADADVLCALADVTTPVLAHRVATLVHDLLVSRPEAAGAAAAYIDRRLDHGPAARPVLFPLVAGLLHSRPAPVRAALAPVLAAPGTSASRALRGELLDVLLGQERDPAVLEGALRAVARAAGEYGEERTHARVHRIGRSLVRTPEGATRFDRCLVEAARDCPGFAARVAGWLRAAPDTWAALVGPSAGRTIEGLAGGLRVPAQAPAGGAVQGVGGGAVRGTGGGAAGSDPRHLLRCEP